MDNGQLLRIDELVATHVKKWDSLGDGFFWDGRQSHLLWDGAMRKQREELGINDQLGDDCIFCPTRWMGDAWQIAEKYAHRMGYGDPDFEWQGPLFKPEHTYLTAEGYPLGTTCWFVLVQKDGIRKYICAETAELAICLAALWVEGIAWEPDAA